MAIENTMVNAEGETVSLKPGAEVDVVIEAAVEDTINGRAQRLVFTAYPAAPANIPVSNQTRASRIKRQFEK